nr:arylsulfatase [Phycisphaerae bacterium]
LFDLKNNPSELHDLSADGRYAATLSTWRERMVEHLSERGEPFVKDGRLVGPRPNVTYSPHFPK